VTDPSTGSRRRPWGPLVAVAAIFGLSALAIFGGEFAQRSDFEQNAAPPIDLVDVRTGQRPGPVDEDLPTVVHFSPIDCERCPDDRRQLGEASTQWKDKVRFVVISPDAVDALRPAADALPPTVALLADPDGATTRSYEIDESPATVFISARGQIVSRTVGPLSGDDLERRVRSIIAEGPG
jgi:peroxiredoxin